MAPTRRARRAQTELPASAGRMLRAGGPSMRAISPHCASPPLVPLPLPPCWPPPRGSSLFNACRAGLRARETRSANHAELKCRPLVSECSASFRVSASLMIEVEVQRRDDQVAGLFRRESRVRARVNSARRVPKTSVWHGGNFLDHVRIQHTVHQVYNLVSGLPLKTGYRTIQKWFWSEAMDSSQSGYPDPH